MSAPGSRSTPAAKPREEYTVRALARGLQVLRCFTPARPLVSLQEIAEQLGVPKGSAFRLVATLESLGYLRQDPETKRYRLDIGVLELGFACLSGLGYPEVAQPYLERLAAEVEESASMAVLDDLEIVYVARASIRRVMSINLSVGSRLPAYCTSMGKVLLAALEPDELEERLARVEWRAYTPRTITNLDALRAELARVRQRGYAINDEELETGLRSVAAPVMDRSGRIVAAINVSLVASRTSMDVIHERVVPTVVARAAEVSAALGYRGRAPVGSNM